MARGNPSNTVSEWQKRDRDRQHVGKVRHKNRRAAEAQLHRLILDEGLTRSDFEVYRCPWCPCWHYGHRRRHGGWD